MRSAPYSLALCAALGLACSSSAVTTTAIVRPQLLSVLPEDFLGAVACDPDFGSVAEGDAGPGNEAAPGAAGAPAAKSYVATLTDVTPAADGTVVPFTLASSAPTRCTQSVTFSYLVTYHYYVAHIEAYTEGVDELIPAGSGSPLLVDAAGNRIAAHWSADCGGYVPSPAVGGAGGGGGADSGAGVGGNAGGGGLPGVPIFDTVTQSPHACGSGLTPIK